jgi:site-specific recombinase XerD
MEQQLLKVSGKTAERIVRIGTTSAKTLLKYMVAKNMVNGHLIKLWITREGNELKPYAVETIFRGISRRTGIAVHSQLLRHTFATL